MYTVKQSHVQNKFSSKHIYTYMKKKTVTDLTSNIILCFYSSMKYNLFLHQDIKMGNLWFSAQYILRVHGCTKINEHVNLWCITEKSSNRLSDILTVRMILVNREHCFFFVAFTSSWKNWSRKPVCWDNWEWEPACWGSWEWEPAYWGSWERKPVKRGRSHGGSGKGGWRSKWAGRVRKWWSSYTTERRLNYPPKKRSDLRY